MKSSQRFPLKLDLLLPLSYTGILGAILFEDTMKRMVEGLPTAEYLWNEKQIVPILKVDKGSSQRKMVYN